MATEKEYMAQRLYREISDPLDAPLQYATGAKKGFFQMVTEDSNLGEMFHFAMQGVQQIAEKPSALNLSKKY
jgi:hypothetical protein